LRIESAVDGLYGVSEANGMVTAVVVGDQTVVQGFGRTGPSDPRVPDGATLVRLQSISKLLASQTLAELAARRVVQLGDPLQRYAPPGERVPAASGAPPITLAALATHTSGLPREGKVQADLPLGQAVRARWDWLGAQRRLPRPGTQAVYSNLGFDLLGDALSDAAAIPYDVLLAREVTGPLGMKDTTADPSAEQCARMMAGDPRRKSWPCFDRSGSAASGGVYSTANDMAAWLRHQLAPGAEGDERRVSQQVYVERNALRYASGLDHAGRADAIGLAWIELGPTPEHPRLLQKTGGGDGFLTYVVIDPADRIGGFFAIDDVHDRRMRPMTTALNALVGELAREQPRR
jgi:D-alanyl-D-alanine-carboxypeptidase/D-alanyl-D-alanine-endopeptidase